MIKPSDPRLYVTRRPTSQRWLMSRKENIEKAAKKAEKEKQAKEKREV
jgi:hypothetical protein